MSRVKDHPRKIAKRKYQGHGVGQRPTKKTAPEKIFKAHPPGADIDENIRHMDSTLLADYFAQQTKRHLGDLGSDDKSLPANAFLDTSELDTTRNLAYLPSFLEKSASNKAESLHQAVQPESCPHTLVISSSGIRAADITRLVYTVRLRVDSTMLT